MNQPQSVVILGQTFSLRSKASAADVQRVAAFVNQQLAEVSGGRTVDSLHTALLALLNLAGAYLKLLDGDSRDPQEIEQRLVALLQHIEKECPELPRCSQGAGMEPALTGLCKET